MHQPKTWWTGLIPLAAFWVAANVTKIEGIEADIGDRAQAAIAAAPSDAADRAKALVSGRDVDLAGTTFSAEQGAKVAASVDDLTGVRLVNDVSALPPKATPYVFSAKRDGDRLVLVGDVPLPGARTRLLEAAKNAAAGAEVVDQLAYASGAPENYDAIVANGFDQISKLGDGGFSLSDGAYSISGVAATPLAYETAIANTRQLPAGATLAKAEILAPEAKPFTWTAASDALAVTISGSAPSIESRSAIMQAATAAQPNKHVIEQMRIARGAPEGDFNAAVSVALAALAKLNSGKATFSDGQLSISGEAASGVTEAQVADAARAALPAPFHVAAIDVKEAAISPYVLSVAKSGDKVTLSGYAPDDQTRQSIVDAAKSSFFDGTVEDSLKIGKGAPDNFAAAATDAMTQLARLADGALQISDGKVSLTGSAIYAKAIEQIKAALAAGLPKGFTAEETLETKAPGPAVEAAACQPLFNGLLAKGRILFETGSATLSKESSPLLDHLVGVAQRCRDASVEVSGHTDSVGDAAANLELSKRRAQAVVAYLADAGLDTSSLVSVGYGETKPVASNDTAEGRTQNRRIEFLVK